MNTTPSSLARLVIAAGIFSGTLIANLDARAASIDVTIDSDFKTLFEKHWITLNGRVLKANAGAGGSCYRVSANIPLELGFGYTCYIDTSDDPGILCGPTDPVAIDVIPTSACAEVYVNGALTNRFWHYMTTLHDSFQVEVRPKKVQFTWNLPKDNGRYVLKADGYSLAVPNKEDMSVGSLTWTNVGDLLGCTLNSSSGVITAGTNTGTIKIKASVSGGDCYEESLDLVDCSVGCNGGNCGRIGTPSVTVGSVDVRLPMGWSVIGNDAGYLQIKEQQPSAALATPAKLKYRFARADVEVITNASGLFQLKAPDGLAYVVVSNSSNYRVEFYSLANVLLKTNGVYQLTNGFFSTVIIENPGGDTNKLRITHSRNGDNSTFDYSWLATNVIELVSGSGLRKETQTNDISGGGTVRTVTTIVQEGSNPVVFRKQEKYETGSYTGDRLTQEIIGSGSYALTNTYSYTNGYLLQAVKSDGSWEYYVYDGANRPTNIFSGFKNQGVTTDRSLCRLKEMVYSTNVIAGAGDHGNLETNSPRQTVEYLLGQEIGRTYFVALAGERRDIRCVTTSASWSNTANIIITNKVFTNTFRYGEPQRILRPNGTIDVFQYGVVVTNGTNIVLSGHPSDSYATNVDDGTKTLLVYDSTGSLLSRTTIDILSGITIAAETNKYDSLKHLTNTVFLDGTSISTTYDCCTATSKTERDGTVVSYTYDALKRLATTTRSGIITSNVYDAYGNVLNLVRFGTNGNAITVSTSTFDDAGRPTSSQDALSNTTTYTNYLNGSGQPVRTTTYPDSSTRTETYFKDGSLQTIDGTAVHPAQYDPGVESEGGVQRAFTKEIRANGSDSNQWTKAYLDMVGRTYKISYSDGASSQSYFNSVGQLTNSVDPDGVSTFFQYNAKGEREYTAVNMDGTAGIGFSGSDRITQTVRDYFNNGVSDAQRTRTYVWPTSSDSSNLITTVETSVDGLRAWNKIWNAGSAITSSNRTVYANGLVILTNWNADGSHTVTTNQSGRMLSVTRRDSGGTQIGRQTFTYDAHGRQSTATDARNGATTYTWNNADQMSSVTAPLSQTTSNYFDSMGRIWKVGLPDSTSVTNEFHTTGELKKTYGSRTYPVEYKYDGQGRMTNMTTWQNFAGNSGTANTQWKYDAYRGFMTNKLYADNTGPSYAYTPAGRLRTRVWARNITTTYTTNAAGEFATVVYSDGSPGITNTYDRVGRLTTVVQGTNTTTMIYGDASQLLSETCNGFTVTNTFDSMLRRSSLSVAGYSSTLTQYGYDTASRLQNVTNGNYTATYAYHTDSPLVNTITFKNTNTTRLTTTKNYDYLNRLTSISNAPSSGSVMAFNYAYNSANQRTAVTNADNSRLAYSYDSLGQVTSGKKYGSDGTIVAGQQFEYTFDDIGNRKTAAFGGNEWGVNLRYAGYTVNSLNQYSQRTVPPWLNVLGTASNAATVTVNDASTYRKGDYYRREQFVNNSSAAVYQGITNLGVLNQGTNSDILTNITGNLFLPKTPETFSYDADGNLTNDGRWTYIWDAENRLVTMTNSANAPSGARMKLDFNYDYRSRRTWKIVSTWTGSGCTPAYTNKFVYDGWNLIAELDQTNGITRAFLWGSDLSGTMQGAGGVGGLLAETITTNGTHFAAFDGNGSVSALVSTSGGSQTASYEFAPFGDVLRAEGTAASSNPFRFSGKYQDGETELLYYGYRYYNASTGRWLSRDPIAGTGGQNLYAFVANAPTILVDRNGLDAFPLDQYGRPWAPGTPQLPPPTPKAPSQLNQANRQFNEAFWAWVRGEGGGRTYGPDDPWTKQLMQMAVYDRMRAEIKRRAQKHCKDGTTDQFLNKTLQWDHSVDDEPWYTPLKDVVNYIAEIGMQSAGSTDGYFTITSISCCPAEVCYDMQVTTALRLGSASRIRGTDSSILPDMPGGMIPFTNINLQIPFENLQLTWRWSECLRFSF